VSTGAGGGGGGGGGFDDAGTGDVATDELTDDGVAAVTLDCREREPGSVEILRFSVFFEVDCGAKFSV
jgi:hypothetical protein